MTVLFCDLVGSTILSTRLDPEKLRDPIRAFERAWEKVIVEENGYVARYDGDRLLVYFGFPHAREDDPERAARAGLGIVKAVSALTVELEEGTQALAVRVGIATGLVVVGDVIGKGASQQQAVVGETPDLAARLQGLAAPNSVVIAARTRALIGERMECSDLGMHSLQRFTDQVRAWRVVGPRASGSRFEASQSSRLLP